MIGFPQLLSVTALSHPPSLGTYSKKTMNYQKLISQLKQHEGFSAKPYFCSEKKLTIGYGTNLEDRGISEDEAEELLLNDLSNIEQQLQRYGLIKGHDHVRVTVLMNMAYQMGLTGLLKFKKMLAAYRAGDYELASKEMLDSRWAKQTPSRANELAEQMLSGEFQ